MNKEKKHVNNKDLYYTWAKGFKLKTGDMTKYHPYTRKDFKFESEK